jgi:hypothetical protein
MPTLSIGRDELRTLSPLTLHEKYQIGLHTIGAMKRATLMLDALDIADEFTAKGELKQALQMVIGTLQAVITETTGVR